MPCVITDGRFDDEDLHRHMESDDYNVADEVDDDMQGVFDDPDDHEDDTKDARLFRGGE